MEQLKTEIKEYYHQAMLLFGLDAPETLVIRNAIALLESKRITIKDAHSIISTIFNKTFCEIYM